MTKLFLIVRKADNRAPVGDGIDGAVVLAADAAAARVAAKALSAGDPDTAWDAAGADAYDLSGSSFSAGSIPFKKMGTTTVPA